MKQMKKGTLGGLILILMLSFCACGGASAPKGEVTTEVTWEELLSANELKAVFEQVDSMTSKVTGSDDTLYFTNIAVVDGELTYSEGIEGYTNDLRDGILYTAAADGMEKSMMIIAPTADPFDLIDDLYGDDLEAYEVTGEVYKNEGQYIVTLHSEDEEWGIETDGYGYFNAETLLLEKLELTQSLGSIREKSMYELAYNIGTDFTMSSYDLVTAGEDTVDVTIHYPDGTTTNTTLDRNTVVSAYYPDHEEIWSVCCDASCTESVDDLNWITGIQGNLYVCEGDIPFAAPMLSKVLEKSSFDVMFKENYNTYFQNTILSDEENMTVVIKDLAWYMDEEDGLRLNFEVKDPDYNVIESASACDNGWYFWTEEDGFGVDFFEDFSYAENQVKDHRIFLYEEQLGAPMEMGEAGYAYYIPYEETVEGGMVNEFRYWIHPEFDHIERVEITHKDSVGKDVGYVTCFIGGNGPVAGDMDVYGEISDPYDVAAIELTLVSPTGEKNYWVRADASISWEGEVVYSDAACTKAVTDLSWVDGDEATVYTK